MIPWEFLDKAAVPGSGEGLSLYKRGDEFSIRVGSRELMNSRMPASHTAPADPACARIVARPQPRVLVGGLGMGYTLAAALRQLGANGRVIVAELAPAVIAWNRGPLAHLAGQPLRDRRASVREVDVAHIIRTERESYDAILQDVDNGPEGLSRQGNNWLYQLEGLEAAFAALRPHGVLAVWSAGPNRAFAKRLRRAGFNVDEERPRSSGSSGGGRRHTIWIATRGR